jgi:SAM-dependent methyltransferase
MHAEAMNFLARARQMLADVEKCAVLELGSHDVNGSARPLFASAARYVGVDLWPGKGVDVVGDARSYDGEGQFNICITTEALEHDPEPWVLLQSAHRALMPGGILILTAAAPPRKPHSCAGVEGELNGEHYGNIDPAALTNWLHEGGWGLVRLEWDNWHGDVYAIAVKV